MSSSVVGPRFIQKGVRERLLCLECEQFLSSRYEDYFARFWYQTAPLPDPAPHAAYELTGFDYAKFKLFHLSVLWRASVATGRAFHKVSLGPHEESIRQMLLAEDPGEPERYPIVANIFVFPDTRRPAKGAVMPPVCTRAEGNLLYGMVYGGCLWHVFVGAQRISNAVKPRLLAPGRLVLTPWDLDKFKPLTDFYRDRFAAIRQNRRRSPANANGSQETGA